MQIFEYKIPFKTPFRWKSREVKFRRGIIIASETSRGGSLALGEAAPLAGHSTDTLPATRSQLVQNRSIFQELLHQCSTLEHWNQELDEHDLTPSARFALDSLFMMHHAFEQQLLPQQLLFPDFVRSFSLNGTIGIHDVQQVLEQTKTWYDKGFRTIKYKSSRDFDKLFEAVKQVRTAYPDLTLRIDVNGQWNLQEALNHLEKLNPLDIEYCEQPLPPDQWEELKELTNRSNVPVALDESLMDFRALDHAVKTFAAPFLIIKPMLFGSWSTLIQHLRKAKENGMNIVLSSLLDSGIARLSYVTLASGVGSPGYAQGLATGQLLKQDLLDLNSMSHNGIMDMPASIESIQRLLQKMKTSHLKKLSETDPP